jgi:hypothetical protein
MALTLTFGANSQPLSVADPATISQYQRSPMRTTGTSAAGAVHFQNIKIPHGATIIDMVVHHRQDTSTAGHCHTVGIAGGITSASLFGSESYSSTTRAVNIFAVPDAPTMPYKVSVSDDAAMRYVYPTITTTTTGTNSISISIGIRVTWMVNRNDATGQ